MEKLVGVVCSKSENKVYCIEGSYFYKHALKARDKEDNDIIYISNERFNSLIQNCIHVDDWKLENVLKYEVK